MSGFDSIELLMYVRTALSFRPGDRDVVRRNPPSAEAAASPRDAA